ncbi:MAG TPA: hypothetical protein VFY14_03950 [Streptomyces sp.]|nr:hypothetical protein [Streptomyces sp.]
MPHRSPPWWRRTLDHHLGTPLAHWGLTALAVLAVATGQIAPAAITGALAALAWKTRHH